MKFKTQLTVHNSSFLAAVRTQLAAASTLNAKGLTRLSLLVAARITLATMSASYLK